MYYYGSLHIVVRDDTVIYLNNHRGSRCTGWTLDNDRYIELTNQLEII
jgi:hypothetical protein